ncbi:MULTISPECIES: sensor histidine kinase [unclassified Amycolatopsis]|uniref:sensor histidine kinase n=1 Tax=unclassified Amycolatopsis TaxID=2618356 RepID=UPI00287556D6|nr:MULTISPECIES: sensor histidine kinase [unclassified Amycolatopsis]MDS0138712.1 sensor histidine kinase [Amycolatopsis sp. 505]MDS0147206.1 sensor histidine kinase [Amycolatopsis sp. CM201R]
MSATAETGTGTFGHPALFYRGPAEYLAGTVPFVRGGLEAGEPVAVAVPGDNLALLTRELGADAGRVLLLDMTEAGRNPGRIIPGVLRAFADRHPGRPVRIIGEPIWAARSAAEYPACAQHEALINLAFAGRDATILCPYDADALAPDVLADAEVTHPVLLDRAGRRPSPAYDPLELIARYDRPLPVPDGAVELADTTDLAAARALAHVRAAACGLSDDQVADVEVVVTELLSNSVEHGSGSGTVRFWGGDGEFVCQVHDHGRLTDPLAGRHPASPYQPRGRGLLLVNHLADLVRLHTGDDGTTFRAYFRA